MDAIIYHNPACGTWLNTLALVRNAGVEPRIIDLLLPRRGEFFREDGERVVDEKGRRVASV